MLIRAVKHEHNENVTSKYKAADKHHLDREFIIVTTKVPTDDGVRRLVDTLALSSLQFCLRLLAVSEVRVIGLHRLVDTTMNSPTGHTVVIVKKLKQ